jgi:hypothetical protein
MTKDSMKGELRRDKIGQPTPAKDELRDDQLDAVTGGTKKADGTAGGNVAGGWDLIANKVHA